MYTLSVNHEPILMFYINLAMGCSHITSQPTPIEQMVANTPDCTYE